MMKHIPRQTKVHIYMYSYENIPRKKLFFLKTVNCWVTIQLYFMKNYKKDFLGSQIYQFQYKCTMHYAE